MNKKNLLIGLSTVTIAVASLVGFAFAQQKGVKTSNGNDLSEKELRAITLENWDENTWEVFTDKDGISYPTYPGANYKYDPKLPPTAQAMREVKLVPGYPRDVKYLDYSKDRGKQNVLGLKFQFTYSGVNEVTIRPPRDNKKYEVIRFRGFVTENDLDRNDAKKDPSQRKAVGTYQPIYGLEFPGVGKALSVWVCGRGNDYELEGWVEDYTGETHILKFGSMNFVGWRPMTAKIPTNIPQFSDTYPATKTAVFKQFKIRSTPKTTGEAVVFFFDELRILTDAFEVHFDGADLDFDSEDCEKKSKLEKQLQDPFRPKKECKGDSGAATPAAQPPKK
ncbi:MAG: flagellar filament outer layer protein FlaA [Leptospiraceae bacterium]|nr:flagellar filament outer layer protein FlaA [Leptospiraceae bacterium]